MNPKIIDMHCDTITNLDKQSLRNFKPFIHPETGKSEGGHISLEKMKSADYLLQCFAIFIYLKGNDKPFETALKHIERFKKEMAANSDIINQVYCYSDIMNNLKNGKMSGLLTLEEGQIIEGKPENLEYLYKQGARMMTLTWNFENDLAYPNDVYNNKPDVTNGLKTKGIEIVRKMNELGMIVDVAHLSDKGIYDCLAYSNKPIIASHSNARTICNVPRNLSDDMIEKIALKGGMTGLNLCPEFIELKPKGDQLDAIVAHMKHIVNVGGIDCLGLGTDFDGISTPEGLSDCSKMPLLYEKLKENKFTDEEIEKIFYKNFLRVFKEVCG